MRILPLRGPRLMQGDLPALDNAENSPGGRLGALLTGPAPPELFALFALSPWSLPIAFPVALPASPALPVFSVASFCEFCAAALGDWPAFETLIGVALRHGKRCAVTPIASSTNTPATTPTTTQRQYPHAGKKSLLTFQPELCSFQVAITSA